jgi:hypothetical protein
VEKTFFFSDNEEPSVALIKKGIFPIGSVIIKRAINDLTKGKKVISIS